MEQKHKFNVGDKVILNLRENKDWVREQREKFHGKEFTVLRTCISLVGKPAYILEGHGMVEYPFTEDSLILKTKDEMKTEYELYTALIGELKEYEHLIDSAALARVKEDKGFISFDFAGPMKISIKITKLLNYHKLSEFPVITIDRFNQTGFLYREEDFDDCVGMLKELLNLQEVQRQYHAELAKVTEKFKPLFHDKQEEYSKTWTKRSYERRDGSINWVQDRSPECPCTDDKCWAEHQARQAKDFSQNAEDYCKKTCNQYKR